MKRLTIFVFCLLMLVVAITADDNSKRRDLKACVFQQLHDDNEDAVQRFKLDGSQLAKLQILIRNEINKASLDNLNDEVQHQTIRHIETVAVRSLPNVPTDILHEILFKLKATAEDCVNELLAGKLVNLCKI